MRDRTGHFYLRSISGEMSKQLLIEPVPGRMSHVKNFRYLVKFWDKGGIVWGLTCNIFWHVDLFHAPKKGTPTAPLSVFLPTENTPPISEGIVSIHNGLVEVSQLAGSSMRTR